MQNHLPNQGPAGWLTRVLGAIVSVVIMVGLFFVGLTVFAAVAGLAVFVFIVLAARVWWLRRKWRKGARQEAPRARRREDASGVTLEGEYEERSSGER